MKIYVSEKETKSINNTFADVFEKSTNGFLEIALPFKSLEQHDKETRLKVYKEAYNQGKFDAIQDLEYKQNLEKHDKELLKAFGNEIIEWFAQYHTYEGISVHKCIERLLKERGVE